MLLSTFAPYTRKQCALYKVRPIPQNKLPLASYIRLATQEPYTLKRIIYNHCLRRCSSRLKLFVFLYIIEGEEDVLLLMNGSCEIPYVNICKNFYLCVWFGL